MGLQDRVFAFQGDRIFDAAGFRFEDGDDLAGDGSAKDVGWKGLAAAGWAVVQWDFVNQELRGIFGTVPPGWAQTAPQAEVWATLQGGGAFGECQVLG